MYAMKVTSLLLALSLVQTGAICARLFRKSEQSSDMMIMQMEDASNNASSNDNAGNNGSSDGSEIIIIIVVVAVLVLMIAGIIVWMMRRRGMMKPASLSRHRESDKINNSSLYRSGDSNTLSPSHTKSSHTELSIGHTQGSLTNIAVGHTNTDVKSLAFDKSNRFQSNSQLNQMVETEETPAQAFDTLALPEEMELKSSDFKIGSKVKEKYSYRVFMGTIKGYKQKKNGRHVVVRKYAPSMFETTEEDVKRFKKEVIVLNMMKRTEFFVKLIGYCKAPVSVVMKYYPQGSMRRLIHAPSSLLTKRILVSILTDVAMGLQALHKFEIAHTDLSIDNIMIEKIDNSSYGVISGLGSCYFLTQKTPFADVYQDPDKRMIHFRYAAPESIQRMKPGNFRFDPSFIVKAGDVYSLGIILSELLTRKFPWRKRKAKDRSES